MTAALDQSEQALRSGKVAEACAILEGALSTQLSQGEKAEALSMLGMARLSGGDPANALGPLAEAVSLDPGEGMFRYNHAMGLEAAGKLAEAIAEHREAVRLSGGMAPLVIALARALIKTGAFAEAAERIAPIAAAPSAPLQVRQLHVEALRGSGDLHGAWDAVQPLLTEDLASANAAQRSAALLAARIATDAQYYEKAEELASGLVSAAPGDAAAAAVLAPLVLWSQGSEPARKVIETAIEASGPNPELLIQLLGFGRDVPQSATHAAVKLAGDERLHTYHRAQLFMALAQHHDRKGDAERAWDHAVAGNRMSPSGARRDWRGLLDAQLSIYRDTAAAEHAQEHTRHFYLCGAPRSGQSLVQSILAASPDVTSVGERGALLPHLLDPSQQLAAMPRSQRERLFSQLSEADRRGIARLAASSGWIVDKNPVQLVVAGSLARIHPGAVFAANFRDPADVAVSIFLRGFSPFYDYATDLGAIIDHLELIADAVAAWLGEGLEICALSHEALVADPAGQSQELFGWLDVEWNQDYLDPASRKTPVPTFSAAQVREPIRAGVSHGSAPYAVHLEPYARQLDRIREKQAALLSQR